MASYYNEWDPQAAAWLRELIARKLIPYGYVDERSIIEVTPGDLEGFKQCHFFAGIAGWPLALQLAGVPESTRVWTGSPPCQPFSTAGQSRGFDDDRHLAPALLRLVRECKPQYFFGEQVAPAIGKHWLDFVLLNLEEKGYTCGASVLPACSVGAPHKRDRLFFGGTIQMAESMCAERNRERDNGLAENPEKEGSRPPAEFTGRRDPCSLADGNDQRSQGQWPDCYSPGWKESDVRPAGLRSGAGIDPGDSHHGFWSGADWLGCRDGKFRQVEPGTFPLADGIPARVGRLRGYGNAIVPQAAAQFLRAFFASIPDGKAAVLSGNV